MPATRPGPAWPGRATGTYRRVDLPLAVDRPGSAAGRRSPARAGDVREHPRCVRARRSSLRHRANPSAALPLSRAPRSRPSDAFVGSRHRCSHASAADSIPQMRDLWVPVRRCCASPRADPRRAPSRRGGRASERPPSSSRCAHACGRCRAQFGAPRRSQARCCRAPSGAPLRALDPSAASAPATIAAARRKLLPQREVLSATSSTKRLPVIISTVAAHCTATSPPSARRSVASPLNRSRRSASSHCSGASPDPRRRTERRAADQLVAAIPEQLKIGPVDPRAWQRLLSSSTIGFRDCMNAAEKRDDHSPWLRPSNGRDR